MHPADSSYFVTLTYDKEHLPTGGSLCVAHWRDFMKRLRYHSGQDGLRFFAVGEYGELSWRPHYHAALFGMKPFVHWNPQNMSMRCSCPVCKSWKGGGVHIVRLEQNLAQYLAGYVVKKLVVREDVYAGRGIIPEFTRMSLRPKGIGAAAAEVIAEACIDGKTGELRLDRYGDVHSTVRFDRKFWPIGKYLRRRVREAVLGDSGQSKRMEVLRGLECLAQSWRDLDQAEGLRVASKHRARRKYVQQKLSKGML